jgi:predicted O-linked N-acetylglucosamine transferase (SPINDLY family)
LEPEDGPSHYTERLALLDSLPTCYARPQAPWPQTPRETWGLAADQHVYFCAQNLLKVHPDFDLVLAEILRRDGAGVAVLTAGRHAYRGELLKRRWEATIPDVLDRVRILPGLVERDYLSLIATADVSLDTLHYGGVNTTYDALSLGTPVVTLPGRFQRGRYTCAVYRRLGISDCVAGSTDNYIELAVRIASEPDYRRELRQRILAASDVLFDDPKPALELDECLQRLLAEA